MKGVRGVARGRSWKLGGASNHIVVLPRYPFHVHGLVIGAHTILPGVHRLLA